MPLNRVDMFEPELGNELAARKLRTDLAILDELRAVLAAHPPGLRRWSVMRAIREDRERTGRDIPQNFEAEVERTFRRFCAGAYKKHGGGISGDALFCRPSEKAGEVWAILPDRASCGAMTNLPR
jgi:hypothetical protein